MLTKNNLFQIRKLVRDEIEAEAENIKTDLGSEIKLVGIRTSRGLDEIKNRLKNLEILARKTQKDLKSVTNFLDKENLKTLKRVERIETHLHLQPPA